MTEQGKSKSRGAYTLLEVLLVLLVLGLLAGLVAPAIFGLRDKSKIDATRNQITLFYNACDLYRLHAGGYPANLPQLTDASALGPDLQEPLMDSIPPDPWGHPYVYELRPGAKPKIYSLGKDGAAGTEDDIYKDEAAQ